MHRNLYHTYANFTSNSQNCPNTQKKVNTSMNCGLFLLAIKKEMNYIHYGDSFPKLLCCMKEARQKYITNSIIPSV